MSETKPADLATQIEVTAEMIKAGKTFVWERKEVELYSNIPEYFSNLYRVMELARRERRAEVEKLLHEAP